MSRSLYSLCNKYNMMEKENEIKTKSEFSLSPRVSWFFSRWKVKRTHVQWRSTMCQASCWVFSFVTLLNPPNHTVRKFPFSPFLYIIQQRIRKARWGLQGVIASEWWRWVSPGQFHFSSRLWGEPLGGAGNGGWWGILKELLAEKSIQHLVCEWQMVLSFLLTLVN